MVSQISVWLGLALGLAVYCFKFWHKFENELLLGFKFVERVNNKRAPITLLYWAKQKTPINIAHQSLSFEQKWNAIAKV